MTDSVSGIIAIVLAILTGIVVVGSVVAGIVLVALFRELDRHPKYPGNPTTSVSVTHTPGPTWDGLLAPRST